MITIYSKRTGSNRRTILLVNGAITRVEPSAHDVRFEASDRDSDMSFVFHIAPDTLKLLARHAESVPSFLSLQGAAVTGPVMPAGAPQEPAGAPQEPAGPEGNDAAERSGTVFGVRLEDWQARTWKTLRGAENAARRASDLTGVPHTPRMNPEGEGDYFIVPA